MRNNRHARATIIIVTIAIAAVLTSLFVATMTIAPRQADALSIYDPDAALWTQSKAFNLSYLVLVQSNNRLK
jgi:hypothetical protein